MTDPADPLDKPRLMLTTVPYAMLMICLAFLAIAVMVAAWPGRRAAPAPAQPVAAEVGTAPRGWLEDR